jgi:hypothetical protein
VRAAGPLGGRRPGGAALGGARLGGARLALGRADGGECGERQQRRGIEGAREDTGGRTAGARGADGATEGVDGRVECLGGEQRLAAGEQHAQREVRRREGARGEGGEGGAHLGPRQDASEEREVPGWGEG